jgi:DNA-binding beta-propeller fold protein YncE
MIDSTTGALTEVAGSPFVVSEAAMEGPFSVAFDPTGKFAYAVVISEYGTVFANAIDSATGALTEITGSPFGTVGTGGGSYYLAVDPTGKFVYVPNSSYANVSGYAIDSITGALTEITGSPFATGYSPGSIAVDPTGKFVYLANGTPNGVSGYTINSVTGALTEITGSPFAPGTNPGFMLVDPAGKFLYVAGQGIYAYAINSTTGALTEVAGSPFATGTAPVSIAIVPIK